MSFQAGSGTQCVQRPCPVASADEVRELQTEGTAKWGSTQQLVLVARVAANSSKLVIERIRQMLWTIFVILLILWLLGMVTSTTLGGFIHLLLIIAIVVVLIRVIQGRRTV